jgi:hypothetical protein
MPWLSGDPGSGDGGVTNLAGREEWPHFGPLNVFSEGRMGEQW